MLTFILTINLFSQENNLSDTGKFNNLLVNEQGKIIQANISYLQESVHNDDDIAVNLKRQQIIEQINQSIETITRSPDLSGSYNMKAHALEVFEMYHNVYSIDFNEALLLRKDIQSSYEAMESYFEAQDKAEEKLEIANQKFRQAQKEFAEEYGAILVGDDEMKNKIKLISEVNTYSHKIFLLYFKVSKTGGVFWDKVAKNDAYDMEQSRLRLLRTVGESQKSLGQLSPYKNEDIYRTATFELFRYFKNLANHEFLTIVNLTKKGDENLTEEDVNSYNTIVEDYNETIISQIEKFNLAHQNFLKEYIPKE